MVRFAIMHAMNNSLLLLLVAEKYQKLRARVYIDWN